jgi:hypothetical protein
MTQKKQEIKITQKPVDFKNNIVLFPKGPSPVKGIFDLEFGALVNLPTSVVARYKVIPKDAEKYKDMVRDLKPSFGRNFSLIPGIRSMFTVPKATDCLEYAVSVDIDKAKSYFDSAMYFKLKEESIMSMDFIKSILKAHINLFHQF